MKSKILAIVITATMLFVGCSSKGAEGSKSVQGNPAVSSTESISNETNATRNSTDYNFTPVKPGTVKPLTQAERNQVDIKLDSAVKNLDNALKSLQEVPEIDIDQIQ